MTAPANVASREEVLRNEARASAAANSPATKLATNQAEPTLRQSPTDLSAIPGHASFQCLPARQHLALPHRTNRYKAPRLIPEGSSCCSSGAKRHRLGFQRNPENQIR